jgi:myo-inositol-1(or 4)-monophosphatase
MKIDDLRKIGKKLIEMVPHYRLAAGSQVALEVGASGDKTFPMDKKAEEIIFSSLEELNEPMHIISEEYGFKDMGGGGIRVIIDPIDGSKNAITGLPVFCTSIAVACGKRIGDVFMSYVINLVSGDEFWAEKDKGAYMNGKKIGTQQDNELRVILYEAQNPSRDIPKILPVLSLFRRARCLGVTALDFSYLALGSVSAFIAPSPSRSFDFAGGWLIAREAGGLVTDFSEKEMDDVEMGLGRSAPLVASANKDIHRKLISVLNEKEGSD